MKGTCTEEVFTLCQEIKSEVLNISFVDDEEKGSIEWIFP